MFAGGGNIQRSRSADRPVIGSNEYVQSDLKLEVVECKDLVGREGHRADPYVFLVVGEDRAKTKRQKKTLSPVFNQSFSFVVNSYAGAKIRCEVWDKDTLKSEKFMGQVDVYLDTFKGQDVHDNWYALEPRKHEEPVSGQIHLRITLVRQKKTVTAADFDILAMIGEGSFGKVYQVRKKDNGQIYAMKVLKKKMLIDENELEHTRTERNILVTNNHPFLINLKFSFQTETKIFFVLDYVSGGEMFFHLRKKRHFSEDMIRFYAAEITLVLIHLHTLGVIYRDLKPENVLIENTGHIRVTDFGLSKAGLRGKLARTKTFCGTPEYLAPEVLQGQEYGKEIDWWSLGCIIVEMLTGFPPFAGSNTNAMYEKIKSANPKLPKDTSPQLRDLISQLMDKDPITRLQGEEVQKHPFFKPIKWHKLLQKQVKPPFIPSVESKDDTSNVDKEYLEQRPSFAVSEDRDDQPSVDEEGGHRLLTQSMDKEMFGMFSFIREEELRTSGHKDKDKKIDKRHADEEGVRKEKKDKKDKKVKEHKKEKKKDKKEGKDKAVH